MEAIGALGAVGRYEFKYLITPLEAQAIQAAIAPYCDRDGNVPGATGGYVITSIYLDTPTLGLYWSKRTLQHDRLKVRVRTYGMQCEGPVFAELKRRRGDVIVKTRTKVPHDRWSTLASAGDWPIPDKVKAGVIDDFRAQCRGLSLRPVVAVRYDREPFIGRLDANLRVTFDWRLRYAASSEYVFATDDRDYSLCDFAALFAGATSDVILEIKFDDRFPVWLADLVRSFDLLRTSFSKYCGCVDVMRLRGGLDQPDLERRAIRMATWKN